MKVFQEEQRFNQWLLLPIIALPLIGIIILSLQKNEVNSISNNESFWGILITTFTVLVVFIFILSINLKTKIDNLGIFYQFFPIHINQKFISWNEIEKCYIKKYNSIRDFGGYGYRVSLFKNKGKAINVRGNYGLQLEFKNGKKLLIGTQKQSELAKVLETYKNKINEK